MPVALLVITTRALATAAPCGSVTVPLRVAVGSCAQRDAPSVPMIAARKNACRIERHTLMSSPPKADLVIPELDERQEPPPQFLPVPQYIAIRSGDVKLEDYRQGLRPKVM